MKKRLMNTKRLLRLILVAAFVCMMAAVSLSSVRTSTASITVVNSSHRDILHVYLSPPNSDDWSADQLNNSTIAPGGSATINGASCGSSGVKVIGEDRDGCFVYGVIACSDNATWTI